MAESFSLLRAKNGQTTTGWKGGGALPRPIADERMGSSLRQQGVETLEFFADFLLGPAGQRRAGPEIADHLVDSDPRNKRETK